LRSWDNNRTSWRISNWHSPRIHEECTWRVPVWQQRGAGTHRHHTGIITLNLNPCCVEMSSSDNTEVVNVICWGRPGLFCPISAPDFISPNDLITIKDFKLTICPKISTHGPFTAQSYIQVFYVTASVRCCGELQQGLNCFVQLVSSKGQHGVSAVRAPAIQSSLVYNQLDTYT